MSIFNAVGRLALNTLFYRRLILAGWKVAQSEKSGVIETIPLFIIRRKRCLFT